MSRSEEVIRGAPPQFSMDVEGLKRWLEASGRRYMVMNSHDLVDALVEAYGYPGGVELIQEVVEKYRAFRSKTTVVVADVGVVHKTDSLTVEEMEQAARQLIEDLRKEHPKWAPDWLIGS